jgi:hypothetical protein
MKLDGFSFDAVAVDMPRTDRMRWLDSQPDGTWSAYPYDQTIRALRSSGYEADARAIAIERERRRRKNGRLGLGRAVNWAFGALLGYGYRPFYAVAWALACVLVGWALLSDEHEVAKTTPVPDFRAFGFALDAFLPISLGQTDAYVMRGANDEIVVWALTGAGWLLTALLVAALTGLLRKD